MSPSLFHIQTDGTLSQMLETPYDSEDHIQRLLADYPQVLGSDQYPGTEPRRWLLVGREVSVPDGEVKGGRWSLDHLYLDQDGIPTLVEVKRESDKRSRREVVGQMLDYAANGSAYWPTGQLRAEFAKAQNRRGADPDKTLREFVGDETDLDGFWTSVDDNMRAGRIRMVFIVDSMPPELLRIVEFLAGQLREAEIYAVEVRHHSGPSGELLATQVMGQMPTVSEPSVRSKPYYPRPTDEQWLENFRRDHGAQGAEVALKLIEWIRGRASSTFSTAARSPSFMMVVRVGDKDRYPLYITGNGKAAVSLDYLAYSSAFASEEKRMEVVARMSAALGLDFSSKRSHDDIRVPVVELSDESRRSAFLQVVDWIIDQMHLGS